MNMTNWSAGWIYSIFIERLLSEKALRKEISKYTSSEGAVVYTLGIFTSEKEAQTLATAIAKASPDLTTSVTQVGKK